jgi:putative ABC transport system permease protein
LTATRILHYEPDRGGSLFNLAPRIMMHQDDLAATGLLAPGSRAKYNLLVSGFPELLARFEQAIRPELSRTVELQTLDNARPEMRRALERTRRFFGFSIVLTLVIAMIATAITARYAASQEARKVAVLRTFGISSKRLMGYYLRQIGLTWAWSLPGGLLAGYLAQFPLQWALGFWFGARLPQTGGEPYALAALVGLVSLIGFSLPAIVQVLDAPPMQVLRLSITGSARRRTLLWLGSSLLSLFIVLLLIISDLRITLMLFAVVVVIALLIPLILRGILQALVMLERRRFWLAGYVRSRLLSRPRNALFVMTGFSLTLLCVLLISHVKDRLIDDWEQQLPEDKPNYFLVNIPPADVSGITAYLRDKQVAASEPYALVRCRLSAINGQSVKDLRFASERAGHLIEHVFNMSYSEQLPPDNAIIEGQWFDSNASMSGFSVEQGMARDLELKVGDTLEFTVGGDRFEAPVTSIRSVVWENFQPNFYILAAPDLLRQRPATWLMSAYLGEDDKGLLKPLLRQFPGTTLLDISEVMQRIKGIIARATLALNFFFVFAGVSAVIVLLAALNAANRIRELEIALLQALGADRRQKAASQLMEFASMGLLVGFFAALFASLAGAAVGYWLFDLAVVFSPLMWLLSMTAAVLLISVLGMWFTRRAFITSPMRLLRS